jgi:hypothetical protein
MMRKLVLNLMLFPSALVGGASTYFYKQKGEGAEVYASFYDDCSYIDVYLSGNNLIQKVKTEK